MWTAKRIIDKIKVPIYVSIFSFLAHSLKTNTKYT